MPKLILSDTRVRVTVTKRVQPRQYEPFEVSAFVETTVEDATIKTLPEVLDKIYVEVASFVEDRIDEAVGNHDD